MMGFDARSKSVRALPASKSKIRTSEGDSTSKRLHTKQIADIAFSKKVWKLLAMVYHEAISFMMVWLFE
jgi:hypothetical protein